MATAPDTASRADDYATGKANLRDTIKWLVAAFAALAAAVIAGTSFSNLGELPLFGTRFWWAIVSVAFAFANIMYGLHLTLRLLRPDALFISDLRTPYVPGVTALSESEFKQVREQLNGRASDLLPGNYPTLDELLEASRKYREDIRVAREARDKAKYDENVATFTALLTPLERVLNFASFVHLHQRLVQAVRPLFAAATFALASLLVFAVSVRPPKDEPKLPTPVVVPVSAEKAKELPRLKPVLFAPGSAEVIPEAFHAIAEARDFLKNHRGVVLLLMAHTDTVAGSEVNNKLARRRTKAVRDLLVNAGGIAAARIFLSDLPKQALQSVTGQESAELHNPSVELLLAYQARVD